MSLEFEELEAKVLKAITPSAKEREEVSRIARIVVEKLREEFKRENVKAIVELEGSVAKDTWLSGEWDIDVFVLFPPEVGIDFLESKALDLILRPLASYEVRRAYAEHPYLQVRIDNVWVDVVPAFNVRDARKCISSVDRTPHHTRYVNSHLKDWQKSQVRLLKKFMKGVGVYGAEVRVSGFSGYLVELLILYYESFRRVLENAANWKPPVYIDVEGYYSGVGEAYKKFNTHLIVVDPVDPGRNVASAVSKTSMSKFIAASQRYLESPSLEFYGLKEEEYSLRSVEEALKSRGDGLLFIVTKTPKLHPDILWGEVKRTLEGLKRLFESWDFKVLDFNAWCSSELLVLAFELESLKLPLVELRVGPKVYMREDSSKFISKHLKDRDTIAGPYISGDRWYVVKKRRYREAVELVVDKWREASIAPDVYKTFEHGFKVYRGSEVLSVSRDRGFIDFIGSFLCKKPSWLLG